MKIVKNYIYNASYQLLAIIVPLITSAYISRTLGPEGVGAYSFTNSIIQYFVLLANMGIGYYGNREIAYVRNDPKQMTRTFWEIQIVKTLLTICSYIIFVIFMFFYTRNKDYMWAQSLNLIAVAFDVTWLYQGIEDFKRIVLRNTLVRIIILISIFTFVRNNRDVIIYIILLGLSTFLGNLTLWPHLRRVLVPIKKIKLNPWKHMSPIFLLFIPQIATVVYLQLSRTMLGVMDSEVASGYYQYSDNLIRMVVTIVTATGTVMLPHVSNAFSNGNMQKVHSLLYKSFDFVSAISYPMMFGLAAVATTLAPKYYGPGYEPVGEAMMMETIIILMIGWSNVIGTQYLLPTKRTNYFTISVTIGAVVNMLLNFPLIYYWGLDGAVISTVISEAAVTLYQLIIVRNLFDLKKLFNANWKYLIVGIIMFTIVYSMNICLPASWGMIGLEIVTGIFLYIVGIIILRAPVIITLQEFLKKSN